VSELDTALERFFETDCVYGEGVPNYGPMAASALEGLGHDALTTGLLHIYLPRLAGFHLGEALPRTQWPGAVGRAGAAPEAIAGLLWQLSSDGDVPALLRDVVAVRIRRPAPPLDPHATIRLGYAIENLKRAQTRTREQELGYAAGFFLACSGSGEAGSPPAEPAPSLEARLSAASAAGAERYLARPAARRERVLGVMLPAALRAIAAWAAPEDVPELIALSLMGMHAESETQVAGGAAEEREEGEDLEVLRCAADVREIRYRAACSVQEHAIVMAESCLRESEYSPDSKLQWAAADAALRLSPPGYREWR